MYIYLYIYRYMYILFFVDGCVILFDELYLWQELGAINLCWLSDRAKSLWGLADNNTKVLIYMFSPCRITLVDEQSGQRFNFSRSGPSTMTFPVDDIFHWLEEEWGVQCYELVSPLTGLTYRHGMSMFAQERVRKLKRVFFFEGFMFC